MARAVLLALSVVALIITVPASSSASADATTAGVKKYHQSLPFLKEYVKLGLHKSYDHMPPATVDLLTAANNLMGSPSEDTRTKIEEVMARAKIAGNKAENDIPTVKLF